ncbi:MAG: hypothetical protein ACYC26_08610 [Phycisphaerales bacterium]
MAYYLANWAITSVALGLAVLLLSGVYRLLGSDLGTSGWVREITVVLITAAIQAGIFVAVLSLQDQSSRALSRAFFALSLAVTYVSYKLTHLEEMEDLQIGLLVIFNSAALGVVFLALRTWIIV